MPKFRKKPVVIEAVRADDVLDDISNRLASSPPWIIEAFKCGVGFERHAVLINTLKGQMHAERADLSRRCTAAACPGRLTPLEIAAPDPRRWKGKRMALVPEAFKSRAADSIEVAASASTWSHQ